jgi:multidrug efflux pump subunit AcrB
MNVSTWSINNPTPAIVLFILLTIGGLFSFEAMKIQNMPDIDLPIVNVSASLPGATPAQLETDVARKLENAIATVPGLRHIYTKIQDGNATVTAEFELEKPQQEAVDDIRSAVSQIRGDLPSDVRDPIINKINNLDHPMLGFTIASPKMDQEALSWFVDNEIMRKLLAVPGIGNVTRIGGATREIHVELDPLRLQALGVTAAEISRQLNLVQNENAGGRVNLGSGEQPIRTLATVKSAAEIGALDLALADGRHIQLDQVATIIDTIAEPRSAALLNGKPVVAFEVTRGRGESDVAVGDAVQKALADINAQHPEIQLTEAYNFVKYTKENFHASMALLYEGAILAVLVVWLFLRDFRATLVSAVALPLSILPAFIGMYLFGFTLNGISLLALSLVIGILVDDAIVEVENIVRHLRMGKSPYQAAMEAVDEIGLAVIATTFTLIAVFLPTAFMSGIAGKFFKQFGWTASLAVFASLIVARLLTPMMSAYILKPAVMTQVHKDPSWMPIYLRAATWCIKHRFLTMIAAAMFFVGSLMLIPLLPTGFIPPDDASQTQVNLELPPGSTLAQTKDAAEQARQLIAKVDDVKSIYTTVGIGGDPRMSALTITLTERGQRPNKQVIENNIRVALESLAGVRSKVGLGGAGEKYNLVLAGEDPVALQTAAQAVAKDLRTIPGLGNIASSASLIRPEIAVHPDFARAADLGVTSAAIGETLRIATLGDYNVALAKLNLAQRQIPIVVKLKDSARTNLSLLERLPVPSSLGVPVMLGQVATMSMSSGPSVIDRYDRSRNIKLDVELSGLPLGDVVAAVKKLPSVQNLPQGVKIIETGDAEIMQELFASFGLAMLTGVLCIYLVLVLLFKHVLHPVTILCALPLALGGAFVGLLIAHKSFSLPSLIGLIMLMGVATKNSILLVEYAIVARRDHHMTRFEALLDACHKRARPIIMTTLAMGAGMLPIAIGLGSADPSFRSPMSVAVIGGLMTSTVLSLLVVPAVFTYVDDLGNWITRNIAKLRQSKE